MATDSEFHVPDLEVTDSLLERVQFSVSSRNAEAKICETVAHVFGSPMVVSPRAIDWSYITTGVVAMLRNKELVKKKYVWSLNLCIYNIQHGVLVWKGKIPLDCNYTDVSDNFHVLALEENAGVLGIIFQDNHTAKSFNSVISQWIGEGLRDDKGRPPQDPPKIKFRKEMISKPCNFQHVQGSQAIEECLEIERIKGHIIASLASFKLRETTDSGSFSKSSRSGSKSKKREPSRPTLPFKEIEAPATLVDRIHSPAVSDKSPMYDYEVKNNGAVSTIAEPLVLDGEHSTAGYSFQTTPPLPHTYPSAAATTVTAPPPTLGVSSNTGGSDLSQSSSHLGRLSPLNLEDEILGSFAFTSLSDGTGNPSI